MDELSNNQAQTQPQNKFSKKFIIPLLITVLLVLTGAAVLLLKPWLFNLLIEKVTPQKITISSEVQGYELSWGNKELLEKYLNDFGFWTGSTLNRSPGQEQLVKVDKLNIVIADKPGLYDRILDNNNKVWEATDQIIDDKTKTMTIKIYLAPETLAQFPRNSDLFNLDLMKSLYIITHGYQQDFTQTFLNHYLKNFLQGKHDMLKVSRK